MKEKNIESVIADATPIKVNPFPLDVTLLKGTSFTGEREEKILPKSNPVIVSSINYKGSVRKVPYSPISTIIPIEFLLHATR